MARSAIFYIITVSTYKNDLYNNYYHRSNVTILILIVVNKSYIHLKISPNKYFNK